VERLASHAPGDIAIPQPVIAEIAFGIERLPRSRRWNASQSRFGLICAEIPRTEWTDAVSQAYGRIKAALERRGTRIEDFDAAIRLMLSRLVPRSSRQTAATWRACRGFRLKTGVGRP
jgi:predicted nucleic acid-binding protein